MILPKEFFDLNDFEHKALFSENEAVWTALDRLQDYISGYFRNAWALSGISGQIDKPLAIYEGEVKEDIEIKATGKKGSIQAFFKGEVLENAAVILPGAYLFDDKIIIGQGTVVESGALIKGPTIIGKNTEVRQGAYVRGNCIVGDGCVVGHTTEIKNSIMLDNAAAGHFAYIGDSILGRSVNLGAGTKLANLKMISGGIIIKSGRENYKTGRHKLGAILGDKTETGCNSVTSPGTLLGPNSIVYPGIVVPGGFYQGRAIFMPPKGSPVIHCKEV